MKTKLGACDSMFDLNCPCPHYRESKNIEGMCTCRHNINDHTYEVIK